MCEHSLMPLFGRLRQHHLRVFDPRGDDPGERLRQAGLPAAARHVGLHGAGRRRPAADRLLLLPAHTPLRPTLCPSRRPRCPVRRQLLPRSARAQHQRLSGRDGLRRPRPGQVGRQPAVPERGEVRANHGRWHHCHSGALS